MTVPNSPPSGQAGALERIEAQLGRIEARLAKLDPLLEAAPGLVAIAGDTFDEFARETGDLDERIKGALKLLERLSRPQTLAQVNALVDIAESLPGLVAIAGDSFDEFARNAAERGVPLHRVVPELVRVLELGLQLLGNEQIQQLLESDLLLPGAIEALGQAARAMAHAQRAPEQPMGMFAMFSAMREPEVQRALGFAVDVARRFGANADFAALSAASTPKHEDD